MRIAFVDTDLSLRTGSRRFTYEVAHQLKKLGHEISIFTARMDREKCFREYLSLPVEVMAKGNSHLERTLKSTLKNRKRSLLVDIGSDFNYHLIQANLAMEMSKKIAETECDTAMVHYHGEHWLLPFFYYLRRSTGVVYVNVVPPAPPPLELPFQELTLRRRIADRILDLPPVGRWKKRSFSKLTMLITPSKYLLDQANKQQIIGRRKTDTVPLGVNHSEFYPTGEEDPFALYLGRIHPLKSLELAIMAMKNTEPDDALIIAGDLDQQYLWYKEKLTNLAEKMKIADRFKLILFPSDSQVVRLMQRCSVFLFPSIHDTFGLVVLEAMACRKPIVACNRAGVPEVVNDAGFLLEPDVKQWRETVHRLLSDSSLREQMGERALERSKLFSWENTTKRLLSAFNDLEHKC